MTKYCGGCKTEKPVEKFCKNASAKGGYNDRCRKCANAYNREWRRTDKDRAKVMDKATKKKHRFKVSLSKSRSVAKKEGHVPCLATEEHIKREFTGKCDICGVPEVECDYRLSMDHDHETGLFRGWLCGRCNKALGLLKDSREVVLNAVLYLQRNEKVT